MRSRVTAAACPAITPVDRIATACIAAGATAIVAASRHLPPLSS